MLLLELQTNYENLKLEVSIQKKDNSNLKILVSSVDACITDLKKEIIELKTIIDLDVNPK